MSNSDPANTTEKQNTNKATTVSVNKKKSKRFLWSNALHMRFLMAMFDWSIKHVDGRKIKMLLLEEPNIYEYCPPSMKMEDIDAYLDVLKEEFKGPSKKAVQKCEEQIKKDYEVIPYVSKAGMTTNFTEYPLKINYDVLIEKDIPIIEPPPEPEKRVGTNNNDQLISKRKNEKNVQRKRKRRVNKKNINNKNKRKWHGASYGATAQAGDTENKYAFDADDDDNNDLPMIFDDTNSPWSMMNNNGDHTNDNKRSRGNSFNVDDSITSGAAEEFGMQYKLHREMMRRHAENIIRYGGYEKLPNGAKIRNSSSSWEDFDIADLMADSNSSSMNHSTPNDASNISDNNSCSNYSNIKLSDTGAHNRLSSNSLSIGGSPDMNANDFAIISGDRDDDDDLFSFLLD